MEKGKQIRMVCHLEYNGEHHYFGNLKVLTDNFGREALDINLWRTISRSIMNSLMINALSVKDNW